MFTMLGAECASTPRGPTNVPARLLGASRAAGTWGARKHDAPPTTDSADDALRAPQAREGQRSAQAARCRRAHKSAAQRVTTRFSHEKALPHARPTPKEARASAGSFNLGGRSRVPRSATLQAERGGWACGPRRGRTTRRTPHAHTARSQGGAQARRAQGARPWPTANAGSSQESLAASHNCLLPHLSCGAKRRLVNSKMERVANPNPSLTKLDQNIGCLDKWLDTIVPNIMTDYSDVPGGCPMQNTAREKIFEFPKIKNIHNSVTT